jgi:endonuclease YncB( thermonuclease family)
VLASVLLLATTSFLDHRGCFHYRGNDWQRFDKHTTVVTRVVSGDVVQIRASSGEDTVRLLGVYAPTGDGHWSRESGDYLRGRIEGQSITLRLDGTETRGKDGLLLAYVYVRDAENVNLEMIQLGHAYAYRLQTHSIYRQFEQAEDEARAKRRGLWNDFKDEQMPDWRKRWLSERRRAR